LLPSQPRILWCCCIHIVLCNASWVLGEESTTGHNSSSTFFSFEGSADSKSVMYCPQSDG
jgi:hypothetical protein